MLPNRVADKLIFQVVFRPTLNYFDAMFQIAASLEGEYEHWKAKHNPSAVLLYDGGKKRTLTVTSKSLSIVTENRTTIDAPEEEIARLFTLFFPDTGVTEFLRVGVRRICIYETDAKYEAYAKKFYDAFYGQKDSMQSIMADSVDDVVYVLNGIKDGLNDRIQMGPIKPGEATNYFQKEEFAKELNLRKETNLFTDVDVFSKVPSDLDEAMNVVERLTTLNKTITSKVVELAKEKTL